MEAPGIQTVAHLHYRAQLAIAPQENGRKRRNLLLPTFEEVLVKKSRFTYGQLFVVLKEVESARLVPELYRMHRKVPPTSKSGGRDSGG